MNKIGIILALYNGEKYVIEQLESLWNQTIKPDIVLLTDDGSSDETFSLVSEWIAAHNAADHWILTRNPENYGHARNFIEMLRRMETEYVFFCDQDDIWVSDKLETMSACMDQHPQIDVLCAKEFNFSNTEESSSVAYPNGSRQITKSEFSPEHFWPHGVIGCNMAVRKSAYKNYVQYWSLNIEHDCFIWACANLKSATYFIDYIGVFRRVHGGNASMQSGWSLQKRKMQIEARIVECHNLLKFTVDNGFDENSAQQKYLQHYMDALKLRAKYIMKFSPIKMVKLLTKYKDCYLHYPQGPGLDTYLTMKRILGK